MIMRSVIFVMSECWSTSRELSVGSSNRFRAVAHDSRSFRSTVGLRVGRQSSCSWGGDKPLSS